MSTEPTPRETEAGTTLTLTVEQRPAGAVVTVVGELDLLTTAEFRQGAQEAAAGGPPVLVLDLERVEFLGSSALAALVELREELAPATAVHLVATSHAVVRPLQVTGLLQSFPLAPTVEQALAAPTGTS